MPGAEPGIRVAAELEAGRGGTGWKGCLSPPEWQEPRVRLRASFRCHFLMGLCLGVLCALHSVSRATPRTGKGTWVTWDLVGMQEAVLCTGGLRAGISSGSRARLCVRAARKGGGWADVRRGGRGRGGARLTLWSQVQTSPQGLGSEFMGEHNGRDVGKGQWRSVSLHLPPLPPHGDCRLMDVRPVGEGPLYTGRKACPRLSVQALGCFGERKIA